MTSMRKTVRKSERRGATAVEFAVIAQVLFACVFAAFEFSRLHVMRNLAQDAAYFSARDAMVPGATDSEAKAHAQEILDLIGTKGAQIIINDENPINDESKEVRVRIRIPVKENAIFVTGFIPHHKYIETSATMRTERYNGYFDPSSI